MEIGRVQNAEGGGGEATKVAIANGAGEGWKGGRGRAIKQKKSLMQMQNQILNE